jgi:hypothetical protein
MPQDLTNLGRQTWFGITVEHLLKDQQELTLFRSPLIDDPLRNTAPAVANGDAQRVTDHRNRFGRRFAAVHHSLAQQRDCAVPD